MLAEQIITPASVALHLQLQQQQQQHSLPQPHSHPHHPPPRLSSATTHEHSHEPPQRAYFNPFTSDAVVLSRDEIRLNSPNNLPSNSAAEEAAAAPTTTTTTSETITTTSSRAMTKQLTTATTTTSGTTISAANLAPTAISPTNNIINATAAASTAAFNDATEDGSTAIAGGHIGAPGHMPNGALKASLAAQESSILCPTTTTMTALEQVPLRTINGTSTPPGSAVGNANAGTAAIATAMPATSTTLAVTPPTMTTSTCPSPSPLGGKQTNGATTIAATTTTTTTVTTPAATTATTTTTTTAAAANNEASGRSAALERAYVHDVYEHCEEPTGPIRPRVAQFLSNLDPGSVVCDVGCGSGRYLTQCNPAICTVGVDRCHRLSRVAHEKGGEVALCDNLELPFRDESFDAVLSLAVVHHFATTERRVNALRELARILRIGGRVVITVWALEQRHRRFESQDVLIPWQPPRNRNFNYSDEEDDDDFLPPYHAYTEDSTNSSRSAGDGDSSSLSSSSPGESCYSFVRRAIQKLAGGRKHPWFLESWTSKETKNDSSLDYEDAKDLPIELRRLEDFEDFTEPPLSAGLKSRSLGSILNPPPRQIVRSRSSVPSLGAPLLLLHNNSNNGAGDKNAPNAQFLGAALEGLHNGANNGGAGSLSANSNAPLGSGHSPTHLASLGANAGAGNGAVGSAAGGGSAASTLGRRPKLIKQKQSLCDEDYQLPENPFHMISSYNASSHSFTSSLYLKSGCYHHHSTADGTTTTNSGSHHRHPLRQSSTGSTGSGSGQPGGIFLRKQSSLNEELMAGNRIREKERVRKRIQKQNSLNEAFLCRSALFSKRLQVIREGFTSKFKSSTGSLERATKTGLTKIMQNIKASAAAEGMGAAHGSARPAAHQGHASAAGVGKHCAHHHHHHHHVQQTVPPTAAQLPPSQSSLQGGSYRSHFAHMLHRQASLGGATSTAGGGLFGGINKFAGPVVYCNSAECASTSNSVCHCSTYHHGCGGCCGSGSSAGVGGIADPGNASGGGAAAGATASEDPETKARRHSRESGSDSSKDSSLQSDTSIESEDSFASVIFIPKPEQHQQQLNYQQQHQNSNSSSSNSSSSNGGCQVYGAGACCCHPKGCAMAPCGPQVAQQPSAMQTVATTGATATLQQHCKSANCGAAQTAHCSGGHQHHHHHRGGGGGGGGGGGAGGASVPTSPLIMPCPPTPAHSPAAAQTAVTSPPQTMAAVTAAMAILMPPCNKMAALGEEATSGNAICGGGSTLTTSDDRPLAMGNQSAAASKNRFTFDEAHIKQQQEARQAVNAIKLAEEKVKPTATAVGPNRLLAASKSGAPSPIAGATRITRQIVNELPPIPKFRKQQSLHLQRQSFPIVRRSSAGAGTSLPKLLSLELFNPATDDLDSDSSEPSSPDSIDSVISAPKSATIAASSTSTATAVGAAASNGDSAQQKTAGAAETAATNTDNCSDIANMADFECGGDLKFNRVADSDIILNADSANILPSHHVTGGNGGGGNGQGKQPQDCTEFAELLSAQLLREIEDKNNRVECRSLDAIGGDLADYLDDPLVGGGSRGEPKKSRHGVEQQRDLTALREELRERRLMLANLSTQQSLQQSPTSSSTSSLSSQTRSFTIHEEEEDEDEEENERSYTLQLYENCKISKFNYKRNRQYNLNPETAYLLQDDGDSSVRDEEDELDDFEHDVILEEDEEGAADEAATTTRTKTATPANFKHKMNGGHTSASGSQAAASNDPTKLDRRSAAAATGPERHHKSANSSGSSNKSKGPALSGTARMEARGDKVTAARSETQPTRLSTAESWEHSNSSTTSLDSPSQGGATTHHRYYHVFREGELDALINHHVTSLHIVSSYYERASWCVVAEKVQVWTI